MALWDLNHGVGCSPLGHQAYPGAPFVDFFDAKIFGVGQETDQFPGLSFKSVSLPS